MRFFFAILSCAFGIGVVALNVPTPYDGLLLILVSGIAIAIKSRKVWLDLFVLEGIGAQIYISAWFIAGLALCVKHYL